MFGLSRNSGPILGSTAMSKYPNYFSLDVAKIFLQMICDECKQIILEKEGESYLNQEKFPISNEEAMMLDKEHRGHECHIEAIEKET